MQRWFEVLVHSALGPSFAVQADDQANADAIARELVGADFFLAHDVYRLPPEAELLGTAVNRRRGEREWLVRFLGIQVHVYERHDSMFPQTRFRGNVPGYGASGFILSDAVYAASHAYANTDREWFTKDLANGKCYYPTAIRA
jgi:hypothetical protein